MNHPTTDASPWGLYPWFVEHGYDWVHPDDLPAFRALSPYGRVFQRVGEADGYWVLAYGAARFRVQPGLFRPVPAPSWPLGTPVEVKSRSKCGTIRDIFWHFQRNEPLYFLEVAGKKLKTRYFSQDLVLYAGTKKPTV